MFSNKFYLIYANDIFYVMFNDNKDLEVLEDHSSVTILLFSIFVRKIFKETIKLKQIKNTTLQQNTNVFFAQMVFPTKIIMLSNTLLLTSKLK